MAYYNPMQAGPYNQAPYYPQTMQPMQPQAPTPQSGGINWVQGEAGAKSYLVGAGNNVLLMDSETQRFFIKSTDASGMPMPLRVFEYHELTDGAPAQQAIQTGDFIRREEFDQLRALVESLKKEGAKGGKSSV